MLEEARLPLMDPALYKEKVENKKEQEESKDRVIIVDISPQSENTIEL